MKAELFVVLALLGAASANTINDVPDAVIAQGAGTQIIVLLGVSPLTGATVKTTNDNTQLVTVFDPFQDVNDRTRWILTYTTTSATLSGEALVTVTVTDGLNAPAAIDFKISVLENAPPTLDAIADMTIQQDAGLSHLTMTGVTPGRVAGISETQSLKSIDAISFDKAVIGDIEVLPGATSTERVLRFAPKVGASGVVNVNVVVVDEFDLRTVRAFLVNVIATAIDCVVDYTTLAWGPCDKSCGTGVRMRPGVVTRVASSGGRACPDPIPTQTEACHTQPCPVDCEMVWGDWTTCTTSCGLGYQNREEIIVRQPALQGGRCARPRADVRQCDNVPCPVDCLLRWGAWSACSTSCGGGTRTRKQEVAQPVMNGGRSCPELQTQFEGCNSVSCDTDCALSAWKAWTPCSVSCGAGQESRTRSILQRPTGRGAQCGLTREDRACGEPCAVVDSTSVAEELSCRTNCGKVASGGCACDKVCSDFGDCCVDYNGWCGGGNLVGQQPLQPSVPTCQGRCGQKGLSLSGTPVLCWCDQQCNDQGDCCPSARVYCPNGAASGSGSSNNNGLNPSQNGNCQGRCGTNTRAMQTTVYSSGWQKCQCDSKCSVFQDCCADFFTRCAAVLANTNVPAAKSCAGRCGIQGNSLSNLFRKSHGSATSTTANQMACYCDAKCTETGDCCLDYQVRCGLGASVYGGLSPSNGFQQGGPAVGSCLGRCGGGTNGNSLVTCFCDSQCSQNNDCCPDKPFVCQ